MSVFLIGYRGSGKTTVGRRLADRLWRPFVDCDERVVERAGCSVSEIFRRHGEPAFRDLEADAVRELAGLADLVVALGGGSLEREANRLALAGADHKIIYLRCDPAELLRRIDADPASAASRPGLTPLAGTLAEIERLLERREPIYQGAMTAELDVTHLSPDEAVVRLARMI